MQPRTAIRDYLIAVAAVAVVAVVRLLANPFLGEQAPFVFFAVAITASAVWGGYWSGLLATLLSTIVSIVVFLVPNNEVLLNAPHELFALAMFVAQGVLISWVGGSNRESIAKFKRLSSELEHRVQERTEQLASTNLALQSQVTENERVNHELRIQTEQLQRSNRELQDFASVASHDLQEPLRKIQAFGERLKSRLADSVKDEGREYLERMQNAAARMQVLINDLLAFSRVTTKAQPFKEVALHEIATAVLSDLEARLESTAGRVEIEDLPTIQADPLQMRQLFQNLIGNALKFHKPGVSPVVRIRSTQSTPPEGNVSHGSDFYEIQFEDNGIGFDEKYLDRIFSIFQRLHGRTEYEGTGIGLAVCRKIVERHGGTITASSREGEGATFLVKLPANQSPLETLHVATS